MSGIFVAIEGPNGVGKSSVIAAAAQLLSDRTGKTIHTTREPSTSSLGAAIRELERKLPREALAFACAADRVDHVAREIEPALVRGAVVVSDRYVPSSLVLQRLDGLELEFIWSINKGVLVPHLTIYLEDAPERIDERVAARPGTRRFESAGNAAAELTLYREARQFLDEQGWLQQTIDCSGHNLGEVARLVAELVAALGASPSS